jgi:hypothetical protein
MYAYISSFHNERGKKLSHASILFALILLELDIP